MVQAEVCKTSYSGSIPDAAFNTSLTCRILTDTKEKIMPSKKATPRRPTKAASKAIHDLKARGSRAAVKGGSTSFNPKEFTIDQPVEWKRP